jgi:hypothetical protein
MAKRLLDRQASLLDYLTSSGAVFGETGHAPLPAALRGVDPGLLRLEAHFSYEKRMEKIETAFRRTFGLLGERQDAILRAFVRSCPPSDVSRISNARQFHDFLFKRWRREAPHPPFLPDVAAFEFAYAKARLMVEEPPPPESGNRPTPGHGLRRCPGAVLLRCAYDVREMFEEGPHAAVPAKRDTPLALLMPPDGAHPLVFEVLPVVFDLLASLDGWTEPDALGLTDEHDVLIRDLAEHRLIEVRR